MTDGANPEAETDRRAGQEARLAAEAGRWRARSRRVRLYRRVLPAVIVVLAGGAVTWTVVRTVVSNAERRAGENREVRLDNTMFHGQDDQGRGFVIGAQGAVRDPATGRYRLVGPLVRLNLGGRRVTEMTAGGGTWDPTAQRVVIGPDVRISDGGSGFILATPEAVIDARTGVVTGDKGVRGQGPLGTIAASAYAIEDQGQRVIFRGAGDEQVRGVFNPAGADG